MVHIPWGDDEALCGGEVLQAEIAVLIAHIGHACHKGKQIQVNQVIPIEVLTDQVRIILIRGGVPWDIHELTQGVPHMGRILIGIFDLPGVP